MSGLAIGIGLKLLGWGKGLWGLAKAVGRWLVADWRNGPLLICALMWAAHSLLIAPDLRADVTRADQRTAQALKDLSLERDAHRQTEVNYSTASAEAQRQAAANVARVEAEQAAITQEIVDDYQARLAAVRARFASAGLDRLRRDPASGSDLGGSGPAGLSGAGSSARGADAATAQAGLPAACAAPWLTPEDALIATEQALQLDALIGWVRQQSAVPFLPKEAARAGQ